MENPTARELIFNELKEKAILKQDVYNNLKLNFKVMKTVLKEMADNLKDRMQTQDERVKIEYRERGEYEAHLQFAGDILIFQMHSNVFQFDPGNSLWKTSYLSENPNRGFSGIINVYNFLSDSFKYNRSNDSGYMIARMFINAENHFMVQGKRQLGFIYNDFINMTMSKENMERVIESAVLYALDFDLYTPPYDRVQEITVSEINSANENLSLKTGKRLGFVFQADSDEA
jgi:hypothetical protein